MRKRGEKEIKDRLREGTLSILLIALFLMTMYLIREGSFLPLLSLNSWDGEEDNPPEPQTYIQIEGKGVKDGVYTFPAQENISFKQVLERSGTEYLVPSIGDKDIKLKTGSKITIGPDLMLGVSLMDGEKLLLFNLPIDINRATAKDLEALPGIGEKLAQRIIETRYAYGDFRSVDDLKKVKGIGEKKLSKIRGLIKVGG